MSFALKNTEAKFQWASLGGEPAERLVELQRLMTLMKRSVNFETLTQSFSKDCGESHQKEVIFETMTAQGYLCFEVIHFTGKAFTSLHLHPEYVVDEVVRGTLKEENYRLQHGVYRKEDVVIREAGDSRQSFDPQGMPHRVIAQGGSCYTYCLSLGTHGVRAVKESYDKYE